MKKILIATVCLMFAVHSADAYGFRRVYYHPAVYAPVCYHPRPAVVVGPAYYGYGPRYYHPVAYCAPRVYVHGGRGYYRR